MLQAEALKNSVKYAKLQTDTRLKCPVYMIGVLRLMNVWPVEERPACIVHRVQSQRY